MRTGVLWKGGEITLHANLEQTVMMFMNGRLMERKGYGSGAAKVMAFVDDKWVPLKMNEEQIVVAMNVIDKWDKIRSRV